MAIEIKRFAAHYLYIPEVGYLKQHVVEMKGAHLVRFFPFTEEVESVAWMPGVIELIPCGDEWHVYLIYPFDFISMKPACGTQRKQLL